MKTKITDGKRLSPDQLMQTGKILYLTDPEIYPAAFGSIENAAKIFPSLFTIEKGLFALNNLVVALDGEKVCGVLVGCNGNIWTKGTFKALYAKHNIPFLLSAQDAEDKYFLYESEHEKGDYILCLCVAPEYRGKGIATELLKHYLKDKKAASLECLANNFPAIKLYQSFGFEIAKSYLGYSAPSCPAVDVHRMEYKAR